VVNEPEAFDLVEPFVVVASEGGPYDDVAFVAGARYGQLAEKLTNEHPVEFSTYEYPALVPQLDLLAMRLGYVLTVEPWEDHPDEWVRATFRLAT
jgi:hypothetical protein